MNSYRNTNLLGSDILRQQNRNNMCFVLRNFSSCVLYCTFCAQYCVFCLCLCVVFAASLHSHFRFTGDQLSSKCTPSVCLRVLSDVSWVRGEQLGKLNSFTLVCTRDIGVTVSSLRYCMKSSVSTVTATDTRSSVVASISVL
jgi:hypothetical protein